MLEMVIKSLLCDHKESLKFGNAILFPMPWSTLSV